MAAVKAGFFTTEREPGAEVQPVVADAYVADNWPEELVVMEAVVCPVLQRMEVEGLAVTVVVLPKQKGFSLPWAS
jgi:hypothetical protein